MSEHCDNNCAGCEENCEDRKSPQETTVHVNDESRVKKLIGVVSGKGGVGKSLVTSLLAVSLNRLGLRPAILDADITGPSIPRAFGLKGKAGSDGTHILPKISRDGVQIISVNLLLDNDSDPVVWRGPLLGGIVKQFFTDVLWEDVDVMLIDMPPGTGDVRLTIFQSLPLDGIIVVTSPQELVGMIVGKAVKMARMMKVPVLGLVENLSYFRCPDNGREYEIFGKSKAGAVALEFSLPMLARLPVDPDISNAVDEGRVEDIQGGWLMQAAEMIAKIGGKDE